MKFADKHLQDGTSKGHRYRSLLLFFCSALHGAALVMLRCSGCLRALSRPRFPGPSVVTDSTAEKENCILFTPRLQYATFPLYSLQPTAHRTCTDAQRSILRWMQTHTNLAGVFRRRPVLLGVSSAVTFGPDTSLRSVTGSGGVISSTRGRKGMMSWSWAECIKSAFRVRSASPVALGRQPTPSCLLSCRLFRRRVWELFFQSHMGRGLELNHISAPWMSRPCAEPQTAGYQIRKRGPFSFLTIPAPNQPVSVSPPRTDTFFRSNSLSTSSYFLPKDEVTPVSRLRDQCWGLFRQPGEFLLLHLANSPLAPSNRVWDWRVDWTAKSPGRF